MCDTSMNTCICICVCVSRSGLHWSEEVPTVCVARRSLASCSVEWLVAACLGVAQCSVKCRGMAGGGVRDKRTWFGDKVALCY